MISKTPASPPSAYQIRRGRGHTIIAFAAMAGPCEVLVRDASASEVRTLASVAFGETTRIEQKFSRYRPDSIVQRINTSNGSPVPIDAETAGLLEFAGNAYQLSDGMFDVTSGVLREAWTFDGSEIRPDEVAISQLVQRVGWRKVQISDGRIRLPAGMQIDLGGIGKEYAADRVAQLLYATVARPVLVNLGGDIRAIGVPPDQPPWDVGVEDPALSRSVGLVELRHGAVATSGDSRRFCYVAGKRLGHILNPLMGWPVAGAPRSVTVIGDFCVEAGLLATMAILHGEAAEDFLRAQGVTFHCVW